MCWFAKTVYAFIVGIFICNENSNSPEIKEEIILLWPVCLNVALKNTKSLNTCTIKNNPLLYCTKNGKSPGSTACVRKILASVLLKLFINGNKRRPL